MEHMTDHKLLHIKRLSGSCSGGPRLDIRSRADANRGAIPGRRQRELRFCVLTGRTAERPQTSGGGREALLSELRVGRSDRSRDTALRCVSGESSGRRPGIQLPPVQSVWFRAGYRRRRMLSRLAVRSRLSTRSSVRRDGPHGMPALSEDDCGGGRDSRIPPVRQVPAAGRQRLLLCDVRRLAGSGVGSSVAWRPTQDGAYRPVFHGLTSSGSFSEPSQTGELPLTSGCLATPTFHPQTQGPNRVIAPASRG